AVENFCGAAGRVRSVDSVRGGRGGPASVGRWLVGTAADVPGLAFAGVPGDPNFVVQSAHQNAVVISDLAGPAGGIMVKSPGGATITVNDSGIYIQNGKGASITWSGP